MAGTPGLSSYPSGPQNADISCANSADISCVNDTIAWRCWAPWSEMKGQMGFACLALENILYQEPMRLYAAKPARRRRWPGICPPFRA